MMDPELNKIPVPPERNTPQDKVELSLGLGSAMEIAGKKLPPPAAAVIAMLEMIDSPFVSDEGELTDLAVFQALYIVAEREKAVGPILRWQRREEALERLKNDLGSPEDPQNVLILANMLNQIADAKADFDLAAVRFCDSFFGSFNVNEAASELGFYLSIAGGFDMLPSDGSGSKKNGSSTLSS